MGALAVAQQPEARKLLRLGAAAPGGLVLPAAQPTSSQLYGPRGVFLDDDLLIAADSGHHRVMIWHGMPTTDGHDADVVLGQPTPTTEGPRAGGRGPENGFHLPTAVAVFDGRLFLADAWHHRILIWNRVPHENDTPPDAVLGQDDLSSIDPNRGGLISARGLYWPYGMAQIGDWFYVADTGNRRVLGWHGLLDDERIEDRPADLVLGQNSPAAGEENRGGPPGSGSFRWPHAFAGTPDGLLVADAGNHRLLGWAPAPDADRPADLVLGQPDFESAGEFPYGPQSASALRFPYGAASEGELLAVADTANNRVLLWRNLPTSIAQPADAVFGQPDFESNGENRWSAVEDDSLCWPYGLCLHRKRLLIADSGNNRILLWDVGESTTGA